MKHLLKGVEQVINMPEVLVANGAAVLMMVIVLMSQQRSVRSEFFDEKLYYTMAAFTVLLCVAETITFFVDGRPGLRLLSLGMNSLLFVVNVCFAFTWAVYADYKIFEDLQRLHKAYRWAAIPALLVILGCVVNLFTPVFFEISQANIYSRSSFCWVTYLVTYAYLAHGVVLIYANRKNTQRYLFLPAVIFMIPILIGSLMQFFCYGLAGNWLGVSIGMVSLYVNVQNEASYIDTLSTLMNRQYLIGYLHTRMQKNQGQRVLAGIMLDVDRFKAINDQYGHLMGDDAIASVGHILRTTVSASKSGVFAARYAGDEFMLILQTLDAAEVRQIMQDIRDATENFNKSAGKQYHLDFSMGYTLCLGREDTVDAFLGRMDKEMYRDKKRKFASTVGDRRKREVPQTTAPK